MKITEAKDGLQARKVLVGCAVSRAVLAAVAERWDDKEGLFDSRPANIIGNWCVDYYRRYGKTPRRNLESVYDAWAAKTKDKELAKQVESLMLGLSKEYQSGKIKVQEAFTIDAAGKLFKAVQLRRRNREVEKLLQDGEIDKASALAETFQPIQMGGRKWVDVSAAGESLKRALTRAKEPPLITYPGAAGEFFGNAFRRGAFVCFEASEKAGKTTMVTDVAFRAASQGNKVAFFAVGDMNDDEMQEMFACRASGRPKFGDPTEFNYPLSLTTSGGEVAVAHEVRKRETLNYAAAKNVWKKFRTKRGDGLLRLSAYPNNSVNILTIINELRAWQRHGWTPDVIVFDYLELLAPTSAGSKGDSRLEIDDTWKRARAMSHQFRACVVNVAQANAGAYSAEYLTMANFSGSKTKNAHVTTMFGMICTDEEKEKGVMRLNKIANRRGAAVASKSLYVAGCANVGNPIIYSSY